MSRAATGDRSATTTDTPREVRVPPQGLLDPNTLQVLDLTRFRIPEHAPTSRWSCTHCGREHDPEASWALTFDTVRGPRVAIVCPTCAEDFRP